MSEYYIFITDAGAALETAAHAAGEPLVLTAFGVCDGGSAFTPDPALTTLENEVYRGEISSLSVSPDDNSVLVAQCIVPASSGGYTIRGIGLYAGDTLYAVGNYPDQPKPAPDTGYAASLEILAQLAVSDTADVTLKVTDGSWLSKAQGDALYVPLARKINGYALTEDISLSASDVKALPACGELGTIHLDTLTGSKFGRYYQKYTANATAENGYPVTVAGSLDVIQNSGGSSEGCAQEYRPYNSNICYRRFYRGDSEIWSSWEYDVTSAGGVINGFVEVSGDQRSLTIKPKTAGANYYYFGRKADDTNHFYLGQGSANSDNVTWGNYLTNSSISLVAGGAAVAGQLMPSDWGNFDARYQAKNSGSLGTSGWFKDTSTGLIFQWGIAKRVYDSTKIGFPVAFPNSCLNVQLTLAWPGSFHDQNIYAQLTDRTAFNYIAGGAETQAYFFAVGH
ncbi:phage tail protein [Cronobacter dublinensis]|uniref:phage tail-collar fiber domain-containing protein n=1 Tax=Cronobacter dublinensis TaxID=413497 RepID=UPI00300E4378